MTTLAGSDDVDLSVVHLKSGCLYCPMKQDPVLLTMTTRRMVICDKEMMRYIWKNSLYSTD